MPIWKINFCSRFLRLSELTRCKERPQTAICCLEWLGRLKCLATGFNSVVNTKLPAILSRRRSTTVSLETYPFIHG